MKKLLIALALVAGIAGCSSSPEPADNGGSNKDGAAASTDPKDSDAGKDGKAEGDCGPSG